MVRWQWLLVAAAACAAGSVAGCLLSADYQKVPGGSAGGAGGTGGTAGTGGAAGVGGAVGPGGMGGAAGAAPSCPPWPGMAPADCETEDSVDDCCFTGRVCGPGADTTCVNGQCASYAVSPVSAGQWRGQGIAVTDSHVVWGWAAASGGAPGMLMRRPLGGSVVEDLTVTNDWRPTYMASDGSQVFWLNEHNNMLWAVDQRGQPRLVATAGPNVYAGLARLVVDGNFVYFAMEYDSNSGSSGIWRAGVNDSNAAAAYIADAVTPIGVALDGEYLYFAEHEPLPPAQTGRIMRLPRAGGSVETFVPNAGVHPSDIVVAGGYLYWVNEADQLRRVDTATGVVTTLQSNQFGISSVLIDDQYLYWNLQDFMSAQGKVARMSIYAQPNSTPTVLMDASAPWQLAQDCGTLFSVDFDGSTRRVTK